MTNFLNRLNKERQNTTTEPETIIDEICQKRAEKEISHAIIGGLG